MTSYICRLHDEMLIVDYIDMQCVCYRSTDHYEGLQPMMNIQLDNFKLGVWRNSHIYLHPSEGV